MTATAIRKFFSPSQAAAMIPVVLTAQDMHDHGLREALSMIGVGLDDRSLRQMAAAEGVAMDANVLTPTINAGTMAVPAQFLQTWLPGLVRTITAARKIDRLVGISAGGSWEDEEVIQTVIEPTGSAQPYTDMGNLPLSSWNPSFERRTVVRFEDGMKVGKLEEARASRMNVSSNAEKRQSSALALELLRNRVGFYGYNGGANRTYGFLNDPALPAYVTVPATGTGSTTTWSTKTFLQIVADIRLAAAALQIKSGDNIDPSQTALVLALPTGLNQYLSVTSDFGVSVRDWIKQEYPKLRVETAPELTSANGGANVFYLYAETVDDASSDGGAVFAQVVPTKFQTLGVEQRVKGTVEGFTNATAGVFCKRPYAVVRYSGI